VRTSIQPLMGTLVNSLCSSFPANWKPQL
jgi:hypothetical protein